MQNLQERMAEVVKERPDLAVGAIAKLCKVSSSAVSQWIGTHGRTQKASKEIGSVRAAVMLERETGYSALWLAYGEGPKHYRPPSQGVSIEEAVETLAVALNGLSYEQATDKAAICLATLAKAPDSAKARQAVVDALSDSAIPLTPALPKVAVNTADFAGKPSTAARVTKRPDFLPKP
jgi:hypothetical protein